MTEKPHGFDHAIAGTVKRTAWNNLTDHERNIARKRLTERQRDVYTLHLAGCSQRQIATMLGITKTTVTDHLRRALDIVTEDT